MIITALRVAGTASTERRHPMVHRRTHILPSIRKCFNPRKHKYKYYTNLPNESPSNAGRFSLFPSPSHPLPKPTEPLAIRAGHEYLPHSFSRHKQLQHIHITYTRHHAQPNNEILAWDSRPCLGRLFAGSGGGDSCFFSANTEKDGQVKKGIHHTVFKKLKSLVPAKAAAPDKPAELLKPSEGEHPSQQPEGPKKSKTEQAMKAAELAKEGAGAAGSVGATVSALKGGDQEPAGAPGGDGNAA
ncbi:hypothetical protein F5050DRAFT_52954 [Lentinula boryana]|uniref:Uncharacterized protein n=1 Tax=Lentinula boryana TaxID=40481 RepID=A0ABQ8QE43_9AGAR|nr:hypothetical protein F5050DRAFT_52954 [Lentinula boryana]